jgi:predicted PurR-regulated permease PerM
MNREPRSSLYETISRVGIISWSLLGTILFLGAVLWVVAHVANLLPAVAFAVAIIFVLNPVVTRLRRFGVPRLLGSCLSYLALAGLLTLIGFLTWPSIRDQARDFGDRFPEIYNDVAEQGQDWADDLGFDVEVPDYDELQDRFSEATDGGGLVSDNLSRIGDVTLTILEFLVLLVFAPVLAFYILMDLPKLRVQVQRMMPERVRGELSFVSGKVGTAVGGFLRGQLFVAFIVGVMTSVGFWLIDLPFWLLIGMIAGFLNIIPFVGPWVGGALGVLVGLTETDVETAIWAAVVAIIVQQIDNHFISPNVLGATVRMHPATIILALLAGGTIAGIFGVLLAVPVVAVIKILLGHYWRTRVLGESWEEASEALIEEHPTGETLITRLRRIGPPTPDDEAPGEPPHELP